MNEKIYILDPIFEYGFNDKILSKRLDEIDVGIPITVYINSPGGSVYTGYSIYNLLLEKSKTNEITVKIIGIAASIATVIAMAGTKTIIAKTASYLIHNPWAMGVGDAEQFKKMGKTLDEISNQIIDVYRRKTNLDKNALKEIMNQDRSMTSKEALKYNLVDEIYEPDKEEQSELDATNYKHTIESYKLVALYGKNELENIINNNSGDGSMPNDKDSGHDLDKLLNEKIEESTNLKIQINQKDVEIANLKAEVADNKVEHQKEIAAKDSTIESLEKKIKDLSMENAKIEVDNLVNKLVESGKIYPKIADYHKEDLLDKKINNETAFNKAKEALESLPVNELLTKNYDVNDSFFKFSAEDVLNPELQDKIDAQVRKTMEKENCSYDVALDMLIEGGK